MNFIWALFRREVKSYFVSPLAYTAIAVFLAIQGVLFVAALGQYQSLRIQAAQNPLVQLPGAEVLIRDFFGADVLWALIMIVPLLTMRLLADERRQYTAELLLTAPMSTRQLIVGKYLGSVLVLLVMLTMALWMPMLILAWGDADPGVLLAGLLGAFLYGSFLLALGLLASSLTENPFIAAILALMFIAGVTWIGVQAANLPVIGRNLDQFTPASNLADLAQGVVDSHALVYFASVVIFVLELTARVVD